MHDDPGLQLLQHSPFAAIAVTADLQVRGWNDCAAAILGVDAGAAIGRDLAAVVPLVDGVAGWRVALAADGAAPQQLATRRADGTAITLELQHQPHAGGTLLFARDVTDRAAAAHRHARQESLLRAIARNLDVVVWSVDRDGVFDYHEGKALATAGIEQGQFLGQNIFALYSDPTGLGATRAALAGEADHTITSVHGLTWESWYLPLRDEAGAVTGCAGVTLDITAATRREMELQAKLDVIERQHLVIRALATPIIEVWEHVLCVPMIGLVDAERAAEVLDGLLQAVTRARARFAVLDLTGIETLDTGTAANLLGLVRALRLLGAEGIITGIHPGVAQTMVDLDVDLSAIPVHATLRAALKHCIARLAGR